MGEQYGLELGRPAHNAQEAVQWVYMAYLAAVKEQDGAAMSLGNVSSFLDIYIEYDMANGLLDEAHAQELIDQFVIKLRMVRHLRMQAYTDIFAGLTAYDTQKLRAFGMNAPVDDATAMRRGALLGALELYLDFINLFLMLLRLFGGNRD